MMTDKSDQNRAKDLEKKFFGYPITTLDGI